MVLLRIRSGASSQEPHHGRVGTGMAGFRRYARHTGNSGCRPNGPEVLMETFLAGPEGARIDPNPRSRFSLCGTPDLTAMLPSGSKVCACAWRSSAHLRLKQLMALSWSRMDEVEEALRCLESLPARHRDDEETIGLTAGVYKRLWQKHGKNLSLEQSFKAYRRGFGNAVTRPTPIWVSMPLQRLSGSDERTKQGVLPVK